MDRILDIIWEYLEVGFSFLGESLFSILLNVHFLGPFFVVCSLAICTVVLTKFLNRIIITKRYLELEETYQHWFQLRQDAIACEDKEKGRLMARNIDKAELNKAYYDYFFEGLLLGIARKVIPIFFMFGFINEFYRSTRMIEYFGRGYVLQIPTVSGEPVMVGAVFCFFLCLLGGYLLWAIIAGVNKKFRNSSATCEKLSKPRPVTI